MGDVGPPRDQDYFTARESQERRLADRATDRSARRIHLILAARYATLTQDQRARPAPPMA